MSSLLLSRRLHIREAGYESLLDNNGVDRQFRTRKGLFLMEYPSALGVLC